MEKTQNRFNYLKEFNNIDLDNINLVPNGLIKALKSEDLFKKYFDPEVGCFSDIDSWPHAKQAYIILLELTKTKAMCSKIIDLYRRFPAKDIQLDKDIADILEAHNKSNAIELNELVWKRPDIEIDKVIAPNTTQTQATYLTSYERGYFIIVNNLEKSIDEYMLAEDPNWVLGDKVFQGNLPPATGLRFETDRFENLMSSPNFYFKVLNWRVPDKPGHGLNVDDLQKRITELKNDDQLKKHQAIALMVVTHGEDEQILGFDACDLANKLICKDASGTLSPEFEAVAMKRIEADRVPIKDIVELFKDDAFSKMEAKMLFFTCCRIKNKSQPDDHVKDVKVKIIKETSQAKYDDDKLFVSYTCLEGYESIAFRNISVFGQAFSHCLARHACDEPLWDILNNRVPNLMEKIWKDENQRRRKKNEEIRRKNEESKKNNKSQDEVAEIPELEKGCFIADIKLFSMRNKLFLCPGYYDSYQK